MAWVVRMDLSADFNSALVIEPSRLHDLQQQLQSPHDRNAMLSTHRAKALVVRDACHPEPFGCQKTDIVLE